MRLAKIVVFYNFFEKIFLEGMWEYGRERRGLVVRPGGILAAKRLIHALVLLLAILAPHHVSH